jgi:molybdopterin/thiamine biosynthesis adenylyltransferase
MRDAALTTATDGTLVAHLERADGQEDLCFALWRPSQGRDRLTALVSEPILPREGERRVHGNVSFEPRYYERALGLALEHDAGLAFLHAHPGGIGWQGMSSDDVNAESGKAAQTLAATGLPLVGLTLATGDGGWSARFWEKTAPRQYERRDCETVRVVGEQLRVTYDARQRPRPAFRPELARTVSAWGEEAQAHLARVRVGVVGAGSVGALVAEALARTGVERIRLIDFDTVETVNLDRLLHATTRDVFFSRSKVEALARGLRDSATSARPQIEPLEYSVVEEDGFRAALDCDVLFSCVDRPWPRYVLNLIAYAHLIPVVDGGIAVERTKRRTLRGANWKAHVAAPGRRCLECLEQYDAGLIQTERDGFFDDPDYIARLPDDHPIKRNENVFGFALSCAGLELNQFVSMVVAPGGVADYGAQNYHLVSGTIDRDERDCWPGCPFTHRLIGHGDRVGFEATGEHGAATITRAARETRQRRRSIKVALALERLLERGRLRL